MQYKNCYLKNSSALIYILISAYFFVPALLAHYFPDGFYIFTGQPWDQSNIVIIYGIFFIIFFYLAVPTQRTKVIIPTGFLEKIFIFIWFITIILLSLLLIYGIKLRMTVGPDRLILLEAVHIVAFHGFGLILILALYYISVAKNSLFFGITLALFILLDLVFMGKMFVFLCVSMALFRCDLYQKKSSYLPLLSAGTLSFLFILLIFFVRQFAADGNTVSTGLTLYSAFSEFLGVFATVGWANANQGSIHLTYNVVPEFQLLYFDAVGHGLALHPLAYFISVFGEWWQLAIILYSTIVYSVMLFLNRIIGGAVIFVVILNYQHFVRHGPDIFLKNIVVECLLLFIFLRIKLPKVTSKSHVLVNNSC